MNLSKNLFRKLRGWAYRRLPVCSRNKYVKKLVGFERRWNMELEGFTKEGFFKIFHGRFGLTRNRGQLVELVAGDGLVGSFGLWMGTGASGWKVMAWEHRPYVFDQLRKNRPNTKIHKGRLTNWAGNFSKISPTAITVRGVREASGVCRGIRNQLIRPDWLGIWNPSRRPVWCRRLSKAGYQLELVWQNMEFYRLRSQ